MFVTSMNLIMEYYLNNLQIAYSKLEKYVEIHHPFSEFIHQLYKLYRKFRCKYSVFNFNMIMCIAWYNSWLIKSFVRCVIMKMIVFCIHFYNISTQRCFDYSIVSIRNKSSHSNVMFLSEFFIPVNWLWLQEEY